LSRGERIEALWRYVPAQFPKEATAFLSLLTGRSKLLYERLDEIGTNVAVIYPTAGLGLPRIKDDKITQL
jgi:hypothetical protein